MTTAVAAALAVWMAVASLTSAAARPPARPPAKPPKVLNIVRQTLKRGAAHTYESLESSIVKAYERANVRVFWTCLQSKTDATDVLYLNAAESTDDWEKIGRRLERETAPHPELAKLTDRLRTLNAAPPTSTLTTRREDVVFGRTEVDLKTMKALRMVIFEVIAGHEGQFVRAVRVGAGRSSPWLLYEATDASRFFLVAPLRSAKEGKHGPPLPLRLQELKNIYTVTASTVYLMRPTMSHLPLQTAH